MPLQENPNLANKTKILAIATLRPDSPSLKKLPSRDSLFQVMKTKSRALISVASDKGISETDSENEGVPVLPKLTVDNVEPSLNMAQVNGLFRDSPIDTPRLPSGRVVSPSILKSASLQIPETSPASSTEPAWSSAIGHASTGKSGRVIERLQGDIDRLHRERQLLKVQYEEVEKANETLVTRNQYLQDRNNNYEHTHETNQRQLERKERQVQELREELKKERAKTTRAEELARVATTNEETWKDEANQSQARATQREIEYDAMVSCRNADNARHQGGLNKIRASFGDLLRQREEDMDKQKKLEIIAEQQKQTIEQLEELTRKLSVNFKQYRTEIDKAIADLQDHASGNNTAMQQKLDDMTRVTGEMRWVMNVERVVNHKSVPPMPDAPPKKQEPILQTDQDEATEKNSKPSTDVKSKSGRKKLGRNAKN